MNTAGFTVFKLVWGGSAHDSVAGEERPRKSASRNALSALPGNLAECSISDPPSFAGRVKTDGGYREVSKFTAKLVLLTIMVIGCTTTASAAYTETIDPNGPTKNAGTDYGLVDDNAKSNQSETLQKAIDEVAVAGGGRLVIPKGTYRFAGVQLKSNVHLLIEQDTIIKPNWPEGTKAVVFDLDAVQRRQTDLDRGRRPTGQVGIAVSNWKVDHGISEENGKKKK